MQAEPLSAADGRARAWMGQGGAARADAPHASSRARRVERRLVGASVGAFGCRNASTACQRDGLVPRNCNAPGSRTSRGGPPGQIWARPSPRAVAASNRGLERGWSAGWGRRLQRRRGRARGCKCAARARRPGPGASAPLRRPARACGALRKNLLSLLGAGDGNAPVDTGKVDYQHHSRGFLNASRISASGEPGST